MLGLIIWIFFTAIGCFILYAIIKAAINNSELPHTIREIRTLQNQLNRQHQDTLRQLENLNQTLSEQNQLIKQCQKLTNDWNVESQRS
ncbi:hypothetical protein [Paenibacillus sp. sgz500958]|uniref:hypothetical protein n=1 Tax=Paenibacillus sp. sgz500958 TaxID=3242475 RepID=UPI0036D2899F